MAVWSASGRTLAHEGTAKTPQVHEVLQIVKGTSMLLDLLSTAATVAMLSFVVSSMLAMGAGLTVAQIIEPLHNIRLVALALLANFVLIPLVAFALAKT